MAVAQSFLAWEFGSKRMEWLDIDRRGRPT
jgi:hypothetical protein